MSNEIEKKDTMLATGDNTPLGFEDDDQDDMIIPRVKMVQTLSPERKDKVAEEGDIINSLTKDKLNDKVFIPVFKYNSNIRWIDRSEGGGIACQARDGKHGFTAEGEELLCSVCRANEFDNSKKGREAIPTCTKYINFFGFMEGERIPLILSFSKTNYGEGRKMYSLAKVTMQNMWNHGYKLVSKLIRKNSNEWYNIQIDAAGRTDDKEREFAKSMYMQFKDSLIETDFGVKVDEDTEF